MEKVTLPMKEALPVHQVPTERHGKLCFISGTVANSAIVCRSRRGHDIALSAPRASSIEKPFTRSAHRPSELREVSLGGKRRRPAVFRCIAPRAGTVAASSSFDPSSPTNPMPGEMSGQRWPFGE